MYRRRVVIFPLIPPLLSMLGKERYKTGKGSIYNARFQIRHNPSCDGVLADEPDDPVRGVCQNSNGVTGSVNRTPTGHVCRTAQPFGKMIWFLLVIFIVIGGICFADQQTTDPDSTQQGVWSPSPTGAAFRSLLFPGWGQSYVHSPLKAVIYGGIEQGLIYSVYRQHRLFRYYKDHEQDEFAETHRNNRNRLTWYLAGVIIMSMLDAYVDAHLYYFDVSDDLSVREGFLGTGVAVNIYWRME